MRITTKWKWIRGGFHVLDIDEYSAPVGATLPPSREVSSTPDSLSGNLIFNTAMIYCHGND